MVGAGEAGPRHDGGQGPAGGGWRQSAGGRPPGHHGGVQWAEVTHGSQTSIQRSSAQVDPSRAEVADREARILSR